MHTYSVTCIPFNTCLLTSDIDLMYEPMLQGLPPTHAVAGNMKHNRCALEAPQGLSVPHVPRYPSHEPLRQLVQWRVYVHQRDLIAFVRKG